MKQIITIIAVLAIVATTQAADKGKHLFILSGQSNMAGLNPQISFIPAVEKEFGKENVTVVKNAKGGRPIRDWYKDYTYPGGKMPKKGRKGKGSFGSLYDALMKDVNKAVTGNTYNTVTFVWMQGERDAKELLADVYAQSFNGILAQLKTDLKLTSINFVIGRLSDFDMQDKKYPHWTKVRDVQVTLAEDDPNGEWVDTDDLNNKGNDGEINDLHYTREGYKILGQRFAEKAIALIKKH
ncbi:acetyl xylan esterase [bacterium F16]|nr:acetyl xylan esterase [bacterium F16]